MSHLKGEKGPKELQAGWCNLERSWAYLLETMTGHMKNRQVLRTASMGLARANRAWPPCLLSVLRWLSLWTRGEQCSLTKVLNQPQYWPLSHYQPSASGTLYLWPQIFKASDPTSFPPNIQSTHLFQQFDSKDAMRGYSEGQSQVKKQLAQVATKAIPIREKENQTSQRGWLPNETLEPLTLEIQHSYPRPWATWSALS